MKTTPETSHALRAEALIKIFKPEKYPSTIIEFDFSLIKKYELQKYKEYFYFSEELSKASNFISFVPRAYDTMNDYINFNIKAATLFNSARQVITSHEPVIAKTLDGKLMSLGYEELYMPEGLEHELRRKLTAKDIPLIRGYWVRTKRVLRHGVRVEDETGSEAPYLSMQEYCRFFCTNLKRLKKNG